MFENKSIRGIYASRYIASWVREGGELSNYKKKSLFVKWLRRLGLDQEEVDYIYNFATNGKMELESDARRFIEEHSEKNE